MMEQRTDGTIGAAEAGLPVLHAVDPVIAGNAAIAGPGPASPRRVHRRPEVSGRTGLGKSSLYANVQNGTFSRPINLGPRAVGWIESEIVAWIEEHVAATSDGDRMDGWRGDHPY